jgi:hypothetical protein
MKKVIMVLVAIVCFGFGANAKTRYSVSVTTQINYNYVDENGKSVGTESVPGAQQIIKICANTPDEARREAESECSTMCRSLQNKDEGKKKYNGKMYQCYSSKEVYDSTATSLEQSC